MIINYQRIYKDEFACIQKAKMYLEKTGFSKKEAVRFIKNTLELGEIEIFLNSKSHVSTKETLLMFKIILKGLNKIL